MIVVVTAYVTVLHRRDVAAGVDNVLAYAVVALVGGLVFEALRSVLGIERHDAAYAALVAPVYVLLMALNLALVVMMYEYPEGGRRSLFRESAPMLPWELFNAVIASVAVFVYLEAGRRDRQPPDRSADLDRAAAVRGRRCRVRRRS